MRRVVVAIFPGVQALDVSGPLDVFSEANAFVPADAGYVSVLASAGGATVRASNGMRIAADLSFERAQGPWDVALVAGGPSLPEAAVDPALTGWLRAVADNSARFGSICTGSFALGAAGLLDGKRATTHWQSAALLARRFRAARIEPDRIFCRDGALITSAGVTAGIDLALALVAEDHGAAVALAVAKRLVVVAQRQGGQSQFSPHLMPAPSDPQDPMARVQAHVVAHLREPLTVSVLSAVAGMSTRHFARSFSHWAGMTPHEFVESARLDSARRLLEATTQALKSIAWECGFASTDRMRLAFVRRVGVTPGQYRASFSAEPGARVPVHAPSEPAPS
ncbi:MAG TPA: GlxA family transcriptional regulator [Burkholderiaceae bacterium]